MQIVNVSMKIIDLSMKMGLMIKMAVKIESKIVGQIINLSIDRMGELSFTVHTNLRHQTKEKQTGRPRRKGARKKRGRKVLPLPKSF